MNLNKIAALLTITFLSPYGAALESDFNQPIHVSSVEQYAKLKTNTLTFTNEVLLKNNLVYLI